MKKIEYELVANKIIEASETEYYEYGFKQLATYMFFAFCQILILGISGNILDGVVFLYSLIVLRRYVGGYHANTRFKCFIYSNLVSVVYVLLCKIQISNDIDIVMLFGSVLCILFFSPVDNINKKLNNKEKKKYKKLALKVIFIILLLIVMCYVFDIILLFKSLVYSVIFASFLAFMGFIDNLSKSDKT